MIETIATYFVTIMFYVVTPLVTLASIVWLWLEDR